MNEFAALLALMAVGLVAERVSRALRVPDLVLFLLGGLLVGPVFGMVRIEVGGGLAGFVLTFGAIFMLYEGGRRLTVPVLREIWLGLTLLSTVGVLLTAAVMTLAAHWALRLDWGGAGLLAAVVASTDPATIVPLFRQIRIRPRLARLVEGESACNDAVAAVLTFALLGWLLRGQIPGAAAAGLLVWTVIGGVAVGVAVGAAAGWLLPGRRGLGVINTRDQAAILALTAILAAYVAASAAHCSAYMAVFVAGVTTANRDALGLAPPRAHRRLEEAYLGQVGILVRMLIFLVLGAAVDLHLEGRLLGPALLLSAVLIFVARPLAVLASLPADRVARWRSGEVLFAAWVRETGAVPAALAGILLQQGVPHADVIAAVVSVTVLVTIVIQPTTTRWWAFQTGVAAGGDKV